MSAPEESDEFVIVSAVDAAARAGLVLPTRGSEDARALTSHPRLPALEDDETLELLSEYSPEPAVEWIVNGRLGDVVSPDEVGRVLSRRVREALGEPTVFGVDHATLRCTFLFSSEAPSLVKEVAIAIRYLPVEERPPRTSRDYAAMFDVASSILTSLGAREVGSSATPGEAAAREAALRDLACTSARPVAVVLRAAPGTRFSGRDLWDVLLSLGLRWGDMDCFHLDNPVVDLRGDEVLFSVETTTEPGSFLPESIAAGAEYDDLVFAFSPARSADPLAVIEILERATAYAQRRLGGAVLSSTGEPVDFAGLARDMERTVRQLTELGLPPGARPTLILL